ncbi:MAG: hypothetical protein KY053_00540 [Candidatus Liptonbacteria bacterium]|nr:hypothetical protein [Candidatus Liptonbacteria bacterium]
MLFTLLILYSRTGCLEEHPAGALGLVSLQATQRAEGEEIFAAGAKIFWF